MLLESLPDYSPPQPLSICTADSPYDLTALYPGQPRPDKKQHTRQPISCPWCIFGKCLEIAYLGYPAISSRLCQASP